MKTLKLIGLAGLVSWAVSSGCQTVPPPVRTPTEPSIADDGPDDTEPEVSAEWLFVSSQGARASSEDAKCVKVKRWVMKEALCASEMCRSGRNLAQEWVRRCSKVDPSSVDEIQELVDNLDERINAGDNECSRQGVALLRADECGSPNQCEQAAQKWITSCGHRYATPLVLLIMTKTLQRQFPDDPNKPPHIVKFDTRSCDDLTQQIAKGVGCDGPEACKEAVDAQRQWTKLCYDPKFKTPAKLAFEIADVLVGAGQGVDPIEVSPIEVTAPQGMLKLPLEDGKGGVTWACGVRPKTMTEYLATRKTCRPGEIIFVHLNKNNVLQTVSVPHPNDTKFSRLFPFLQLKGETDARAKARVSAFRNSMAEVVELASGNRPQQAIGPFTRAVMDNLWLIAKHDQFKQILRDSDLALAPMFRAWGKKKLKKLYRIRNRGEQIMYAGRTRHSPLDDMTPDGTVHPEAFATPFSLDLRKLMPSAMAAYEDTLTPLRLFQKTHKLKSAQLQRLREHVTEQINVCGAHEQRIEAALEKAEHCIFEEMGCTQDKMKAISAAVDPSRDAARKARMAIQLILDSWVLGQDESEQLDSQRVANGCLDP